MFETVLFWFKHVSWNIYSSFKSVYGRMSVNSKSEVILDENLL